MGCARWHDHKFDPVLQTDCYRIQAVFAGVRHGERSIAGPGEDAARQQQIATLERQVAAANARLAELRSAAGGKPAARGGPDASMRPQVSPQENVDEFPAAGVRFLRFTVQATTENAEPCRDELGVFAAAGTNLARGAPPTASSTLPGFEIHRLEHVNDGRYGTERHPGCTDLAARISA